ncbi:thermonuclease family protein [Mongoliimonas terrestris]|uniref:thermonuclease family protein n=1 Tax=Mongoliimonas terrestris TaxID=1709001 RepID=UPI0009FA85BA|nr:thermonuclease family protein [Mongoliimonas terrestris]
MLVSMSIKGALLATLAGLVVAAFATVAGAAPGSAPCTEGDRVVVALHGAAIGAIGTVVPVLAVETAAQPASSVVGVRLEGVVLPAIAGPALREALAARLNAVARRGAGTVRLADRRPDRHGRWSGHLIDAAGTWVQADLVEAGLAVADAEGDCAAALIAAEAAARRARQGIWAADDVPVRIGPDGRARLPVDFVVVEGRVRTVGNAGRTTYLNFGADFARDVTIVIDGRTLARFDADNRLPAGGPAGWAGRLVRARGWATAGSGGEIRLASPHALELLDGDPPSDGDEFERNRVPLVDDK